MMKECGVSFTAPEDSRRGDRSVPVSFFDLGVFALDLLDEELDVGAPLGRIQVHDLGP
jgi:hypothetical protein